MNPIFINNSKTLVWINKITFRDMWAFSFAIWVFCKREIGSVTKRHETIHFKQQLELLFVFQWVLYSVFWLIGLVIYRTTYDAYRNNPFEVEAYKNQRKKNYLDVRPYYNWTEYMWEIEEEEE